MIEKINTIREALSFGTPDHEALRALAKIEQAMREPVAWGMQNDDGRIYDCITPEEHARMEGEYTTPLFAAPPAQQAQPTVQHMVDRFLGWKVPANFQPDGGVSFKPYHPQQTPGSAFWPSGTNLLTAEQAKAMFDHVLKEQP